MSLTPEALRKIVESPRAKLAQFIYAAVPTGKAAGRRVPAFGRRAGKVEDEIEHRFVNCSPIGNRAGALVGFAFTTAQLEKLLEHPEVRGRDLARGYFNQFAHDAGSLGRYILVGEDLDVFLDLLAGVVKK